MHVLFQGNGQKPVTEWNIRKRTNARPARRLKPQTEMVWLRWPSFIIITFFTFFRGFPSYDVFRFERDVSSCRATCRWQTEEFQKGTYIFDLFSWLSHGLLRRGIKTNLFFTVTIVVQAT